MTRARRIVLAAMAALDTTVLAVVSHRAAGILLAGIGLLALFFFARGRRPLTTGLVALTALAALETLGSSLSGGHQRVFFASGATLAGWLVGLAFARRTGDGSPTAWDGSFAEAGAIAGLAATYVDAGLSKLLDGGLHWVDATSVQVAVLVNHPVDDPSPLAHYARFLVEHPGAAQALSIATLAFELGAVALLLGPRVRMLWASLLVAFHVNVALVADIYYVEACVLLVAFSFPPKKSPVPEISPERARDAIRAVGRWVVVAVAAAWLFRSLGAMGR